MISVFALDLTCAGESKTLLCSGISFHFWHCRKSNLVKHSVQRYELFRRFFARRRFFTARRRSGLSAAIAIAGCGCPISRAIRCVARVEECAAETRYKGVLRSLRPAILRQSILTSEFFQVLLPDDGMFDPSFSRANRSSLLHASFRISASLRILSLGKLQIRFAFVSGFSYLVLHIRRRQS